MSCEQYNPLKYEALVSHTHYTLIVPHELLLINLNIGTNISLNFNLLKLITDVTLKGLLAIGTIKGTFEGIFKKRTSPHSIKILVDLTWFI